VLEQVRKRLTYSNVVATLALFGVLAGGVAVGASLKKNSVGKKQLKRGAVVTQKIGAGAVATDKLADGAVTTPKLGESSVTGPKVDESTLGTVPSAFQATDSTNAINAVNATTATAAGTSANAQALGGSPLSAVRSTTNAVVEDANFSLGTAQGTVASQAISVPAGGGTVTAFASINLFNPGGGGGSPAVEADCILESGRGGTFASMAPSAFIDFPATAPTDPGYDVQIPLVGFAQAVPAGTQTVRASCRQTTSGNAAFESATLVVEMHPTG